MQKPAISKCPIFCFCLVCCSCYLTFQHIDGKGPLPTWHCRFGGCFLTKVNFGLGNVEQNNYKKRLPCVQMELLVIWKYSGPGRALHRQSLCREAAGSCMLGAPAASVPWVPWGSQEPCSVPQPAASAGSRSSRLPRSSSVQSSFACIIDRKSTRLNSSH